MAFMLAIPIFMSFLSLALPAKVNRWTNIIVGILHIVIMITSIFAVQAETWAYYALYMFFEAMFITLIVWHAWKWPTQEANPRRENS